MLSIPSLSTACGRARTTRTLFWATSAPCTRPATTASTSAPTTATATSSTCPSPTGIAPATAATSPPTGWSPPHCREQPSTPCWAVTSATRTPPARHLWQTPVGPRLLPWLADHAVADVPVLPGTGMVEMMPAAGARTFGTDRIAASDVHMLSPLVLDPEPQVTTRLIHHADNGTAFVEILTTGDDGMTVHARGTVRPLPEHDHPALLTAAESNPQRWRDSDVAALHRTFRDRHDVFHGPAFSAIDHIRVHPTKDLALSTLHTHDSARVSAWTMSLYPALADQVIQTAVSAWLAHYTLAPGPVVVARFDEVRVYRPTAHTRTAAIRVHTADDLGCTASARPATADGTVVAVISGLRVANVTPPEERFTGRLLHQAQILAPAPAERSRATDGTWIVLTTDESAWPVELARELGKQTAECRLLPLADPAAPAPCTGIALAMGDEQTGRTPAEAARILVTRTVALVRRLTSWDPRPGCGS
ncbi:polyketide synthase dehydratase domain-containing protein [Embleya sp. NPDC059237]|uniref:polyketide synthase dehydratase domain-containing protein n=1 Tax=Embleya sp. NPDC059237 TaxID=3346784 RepID=UPI00368B1A8A